MPCAERDIAAIFATTGESTEDALDDSRAVRRFIGIDRAREGAPDATTRLKFRRLLEKHSRTEPIFAPLNEPLSGQGLLLREGTVVDATIITAPSSTQNRKDERDPERPPTQKSNPWHFGMKAPMDADAQSGGIHTLVATPANSHEVTQAHAWLPREEYIAFGDAGYQGVEKREENRTPDVKWPVTLRPGQRKAFQITNLAAFFAYATVKLQCCPDRSASVTSMSRLNLSHFPRTRSETRDCPIRSASAACA